MRKLMWGLLIVAAPLAIPRAQALGESLDELIEIQRRTPQDSRFSSSRQSERADAEEVRDAVGDGDTAASPADDSLNLLTAVVLCSAVAGLAILASAAIWHSRRKAPRPVGPMFVPGASIAGPRAAGK
jgi:hypothetical protein